MKLLVKASRTARTSVEVTPQSAGWNYVGFAAHRLARGDSLALNSGAREICIVVLRGVVSVRAGEQHWKQIGERDSVFAGRSPYAVYVPGGEDIAIDADSDAEEARCTPPAVRGYAPRLI